MSVVCRLANPSLWPTLTRDIKARNEALPDKTMPTSAAVGHAHDGEDGASRSIQPALHHPIHLSLGMSVTPLRAGLCHLKLLKHAKPIGDLPMADKLVALEKVGRGARHGDPLPCRRETGNIALMCRRP